MANHIPFNQRRNSRRQPPVYIGFEPYTAASNDRVRHNSHRHNVPRHHVHGIHYANQRHYQRAYRNRRPFNWSGFLGFLLALLSPLTAFLLAPIALLISLRGLRRPRRVLAFLGTLISLGGTAILAVIAVALISEHHERATRYERAERARIQKVKTAETKETLSAAAERVEKFVDDNQGFLPEGIEGNTITVRFTDAWGTELRYDLEDDRSLIRSAGPDEHFDSDDDLTTAVKGIPGSLILADPEWNAEAD